VTPAVPAGSLASMNQPGIAGSDILLRPWQPADQEAVVTAFTDPAIQQWHARSVTEAEAQDWIAQWPRRWQSESAASWAVIDGGVVAGQIGLRRIDLDEGLASISYWVLPEARGRRLAPRALTVLTTWAFEDLGLHRLELSHSTANAAMPGGTAMRLSPGGHQTERGPSRRRLARHARTRPPGHRPGSVVTYAYRRTASHHAPARTPTVW
jgi:RimJ/RimL family protein N-acetyltransferase